MKFLVSIILAFAATAALADSTHECQGNSCNGSTGGTVTNNVTVDPKVTNTNVNTNVNAPVSKSDAKASAVAGAASFSGSAAKATGGSATGGQGVGSVTVQGDTQIRQAPGLGIAATSTTASCRVAVSAGVSGPGFAIAGGSAIKDEKCDKRAQGLALIDAARVAQQIGAPGEFYAPIFIEGLALIRASGDDEKAEPKSSKTPTANNPTTITQQSYSGF